MNFFEIMKNSMNLNILIFDVLLGMIIVLMAKTGGSAAYGKWAGTKIRSKKSALLATTGLGILIFVDDYFNCLTVGSVMRPVTDQYKVSRAKLAYIIDSTAAPVCIIAPISSWAAAVNSYVPEDAGITGFQLFLRTIPYNLYAILTLFMVIFITVTAFDFGLMKKHEDNAAKGDLFTSGSEEFEQISEDEVNPNGKVIDLVLPVAVLIVSAIGAMIYTGFLGGATDIITAFSGCDAETSLIFATLITIFFMLLLYLPRKVVNVQRLHGRTGRRVQADGSGGDDPDLRLVAERHGRCAGPCGFRGPRSRRQCIRQRFYPGCHVCRSGISVIFNRTSWGTFAILVPIATALFSGGGDIEMMVISVSAVLAGAVCGDHISRSRIQRSCRRPERRATISTMYPLRCSMPRWLPRYALSDI